MAQGTSVLLVGLDPFAKSTVIAALNGTWNVVEAVNGAAAEEAVKERAYPVILLDLDIADRPAVEVIKSVVSRHRTTSIIALVDSERRSEAFLVLEAGAMTCLLKPVNRAGLRGWVLRAFERSQLSQDLSQATQRMEELIEAINEFLASVSHDLRTPLAIMHGYAETLLHYGEKLSIEKRTAYLSYIRDGSRKMTQQMAEYLDLSRKGSNAVMPENTDIPDLMRAAYEPLAAGRAVALELHFEDSAREAITDKRRLAHALQYAVGEALRHAPEGEKICASGVTFDASIVIHLADQYIDDRAATRPADEAGEAPNVGLTIARCILKVLGGDIWSNRKDDRPRLTLTLPKEYRASRRDSGEKHG